MGCIKLDILDRSRDSDLNLVFSSKQIPEEESPWSKNRVNYYQADIIAYSDYYPFGSLMPGRFSNPESYRYGMNGMEKDNQVKGAGNSYTTEFRQYDPRLGRWLSLDPEMASLPSMSPYQSMRNNPIFRIDPKGNLDDEYDKDGNKISDLGGDKIDFHHQENGDTKVVDKETGSSNIITGGEQYIKGYNHRSKDISWKTIAKEWATETGPRNSLISDFDDTQLGAFGSLDAVQSTYSSKARADADGSEQNKNIVTFNYSETNPFTAGDDMWEQMWGRTTISWYKVGDKVVFMMLDSKSKTSASYRLFDSNERYEGSMGNTYQTYLWTESASEVKLKVEAKEKQDKAYAEKLEEMERRERENIVNPKF